jgi:hypothetical protein
MERAPPSGFIAVFGPTACGQNCDCSRRNGAWGGCSVGCRDGLPVHSYSRVADAASEQRHHEMGKEATGDILLLADATVKIRWPVGGTQCLHEGCQAVG